MTITAPTGSHTTSVKEPDCEVSVIKYGMIKEYKAQEAELSKQYSQAKDRFLQKRLMEKLTMVEAKLTAVLYAYGLIEEDKKDYPAFMYPEIDMLVVETRGQ